MLSPVSTSARGTFSERLWFGPLGWGAVVAFGLGLGAVLIPVDTLLALVVAVLALAGGLGVSVLATPRVQVDRGTLRAGSAHIPVRLLGEPQVLDRGALRVELGPGLDARAFVLLRAWIGTAVRVEVRDGADPTPYWLISTRRPDRLIEAMGLQRAPSLGAGPSARDEPGPDPA